MKTRILFLILTCFAFFSKAQLTELRLKVPLDQVIVYADERLVYSFNHKAFYTYTRKVEDFHLGQYRCDTILWRSPYFEPVKYDAFISQYSCSFKDSLNGVILRPVSTGTNKAAVLKTSDGGRHWCLVAETPASILVGNASVAFNDFNKIYVAFGKVYLLQNSEFKMLDFDTNSTYSICQKGNVIASTSVYNKFSYASSDGGQSWKKYEIPADTGIKAFIHLSQQLIRSGRIYLHHVTSRYTPDSISALSYVTIIDPLSGKVSQQQYNQHYESIHFDSQENMYLVKPKYSSKEVLIHSVIHRIPNFDLQFYVASGKKQLLTSCFKIGSNGFRNDGQQCNVFRFSDSTVYLFDHPDCGKLVNSKVVIRADSVDIFPVTTGSIAPIHHPQAITLDITNGDTISDNCCWYYYHPSFGEFNWYGKKIRQPKSDSLFLTIKSQHDTYSKCVIKTKWDTQVILSAENDPSVLQSVSLYPNPASEMLNFTNLESGSVLEIADFTGQIILKHNYVEKERVDIQSLKTGSYSLKIMSGNKPVNRLIFIKN